MKTMKSPMKIGFVGAGYMASEHARAFATISGVEIVGFVGRSPERVQALAQLHKCPAFSDVHSLYAATRADAVVVAVPELACREICEQVFEYPWSSLLEKPVGQNYADAEHLSGLARSKGRQAFVALNRRSFAATREAQRLLSDDPSPRLVLVHDTQDINVARGLGQPEEVVSNWMFANSIHLVDYLHQFCRGEVVEVKVGAPFDPAEPRAVSATVAFSSGDSGVYVAAWNMPGPWFVTIANQSLRAELRPLEQLGTQKLGERSLTPFETHPDDAAFKPGLMHQARAFVQSVSGKESKLATLDEATRSMRLVAQIYGRI
jgi:predicted dehydrogenase